MKEPHLEEKYRKKIVVIKRVKMESNGDKSSMLLIQDVTAFHMVDKEIKDNLSMIQTNMCISNQIKKPLKIVNEISSHLIKQVNKMSNSKFPQKGEFLEHMRAI